MMRGTDDGLVARRTPEAIPEIGARAGDILVFDPYDAARPLTLVRHVDLAALHRVRQRLIACARLDGAA